MEISAAPSRPIDSGLIGLVLLARFHGVAAAPDQIRHQFGVSGKPFTSTEVVRAARALELKAREMQSTWSRLRETPIPALVSSIDGRFLVLGAVSADQALVQDPAEQRPKTVPRDEFLAMWSGRVILIAKRSLLPGVTGKFDLSWFIPSLVKYRRLLSEVL